MPKDVFLNLPDVAQDKILLAAAETFIAKGLRDTTIEDVAAKLNVQAEVLSRYFDGMRDVLAAVLGRTIQLFNQAYIEVGKMQSPFWPRVERLFVLAAERGYRYRSFFNVYQNIGAMGLHEMAQATFDRFEGRAALFFQNLTLSGVQEGALRDDVDVAHMAMHFHVLSRMLIARRYMPLFHARSMAYFPEISFDEEGDQRLIRRTLTSLRTLYAPN